MTLLDQFKAHFNSQVRTRGEKYANSGMIGDLHFPRSGLLITSVDGSDGELYEVEVESDRAQPGMWRLRCTCPHFGDGHFCKHLWAVLTECERLGWPFVKDAQPPQQITRSYRTQAGSNRAATTRNGRAARKTTTAGNVSRSASQLARTQKSPVPASPARERTQKSPAKRRKQDSWQETLATALHRSGVASALDSECDELLRAFQTGATPESHVAQPWEFFFGITPVEMQNSNAILVSFLGRPLSAGSEPARVWEWVDVATIFDSGSPQEKETAAILLENEQDQDGQVIRRGADYEFRKNRRNSQGWGADSKRQLFQTLFPYYEDDDEEDDDEDEVEDCAQLSRQLAADVWKRLCELGKFGWSFQGTDSPAAAARTVQPLRWDGDLPYDLKIAVESDPEVERWRFSSQLVQRETGRVLTPGDVLEALESGVLLGQESLFSLTRPADGRWWNLARQLQSQALIPFSDTAEFRQILQRDFAGAPLHLPEELAWAREMGEPRPRLRIFGTVLGLPKSNVTADVDFLYGEHVAVPESEELSFWNEATQTEVTRNLVREQESYRELATAGLSLVSEFIRGNWAYSDSDNPVGRLQLPVADIHRLVETLGARGWIVEVAGARMRVFRAGSLALQSKSGVDWFDLTGHFEFDDATLELPELLQALKSGEDYVRFSDGSQGMLPPDWKLRLQRLLGLTDLKEAEEKSLRFRGCQALLLDSWLTEKEQDSLLQTDQHFRALRDRLLKFEGVQPQDPPATFQGELRPYQKQGLGWLMFLQEFGFGGCLADDMGLGKTVQVLALLEARRLALEAQPEEHRPSLIVVPRSLVGNWMTEAARFTPALKVQDVTATGREVSAEILQANDVLLSTYGTLRQDIAALKDFEFDYVILDESQAIKNANTQTARTCRLLNARHRLTMTGTPVENHLGELWSQVEFLNPGMLGRSDNFRKLTRGENVEFALSRLSRGLAPFILRRTKQQVLQELPEKIEQTLYCELSPRERKQYDQLKGFFRANLTKTIESKGLAKSKMHVLEALLRLRQVACHAGLVDEKQSQNSSAKLDVLCEQLERVLAEKHKVLIFSQFTSLLTLVKQQLDQHEYVYEYLDGRTKKRAAIVERFQTDPNCQLFLISLKAGGTGLNLTAADYVFILDPWWNPAVEAQAVDRAHRIGQTNRVIAYRLIARDTVEERILELQQSKKKLAEAIVSGDGSLLQSLTPEDLQLLLS